ncbi:MAG: DUF2927 domain-containing protein [Inquilinaceae bacterium]
MKCAWILAFVLAGCGGGVLVERPDEVPAATLAGRFEQHAFFEENTNREIRLGRFEDEVRFHFIFSDQDRFTTFMPDLSAVIDDLIDLTGRPMDVDNERPNFVVMMDRRDVHVDLANRLLERDGRTDLIAHGFVELASRATCAGWLTNDPLGSGRIDSAIVYLPDDLNDEDMRRCIVQEIAQSFGLINDVADPDGTVFSSGSRRTTLSETDRKLIQILYDDRLHSGMTRAEAMPIVRRIIAEKGW